MDSIKGLLARWILKLRFAEVEVPYRAAVVILPTTPENEGWQSEDIDHLNATLEQATGHPVATLVFRDKGWIALRVTERLP